MSETKRYDVPAQARALRCKAASCQAWICFVASETGKQMPVNLSGEHKGEPHWIHCVAPKQFKGQGRLF